MLYSKYLKNSKEMLYFFRNGYESPIFFQTYKMISWQINQILQTLYLC
jgi:hypothetical protein